MGPQTTKLINKIEELLKLLTSCNEKYWSNWFLVAKQEILNEDFYGIKRILNAYGGMGSFNDLTICKYNGDDIKVQDEDKVNTKLKSLANEIYNLAEEIRREVEGGHE